MYRLKLSPQSLCFKFYSQKWYLDSQKASKMEAQVEFQDIPYLIESFYKDIFQDFFIVETKKLMRKYNLSRCVKNFFFPSWQVTCILLLIHNIEELRSNRLNCNKKSNYLFQLHVCVFLENIQTPNMEGVSTVTPPPLQIFHFHKIKLTPNPFKISEKDIFHHQ